MIQITAEQFLEHVSPEPNTGCWLWTGSVTARGYGRLRAKSGDVYAHRAAYELFVGPLGELEACHACDTPGCVNPGPGHLFAGTHRENMQDAARKGRLTHDNYPGPRKLKPEQVAEIRRRAADGETLTALGRAFGVDRTTIGLIHRGRTWVA